MGRLPASTIGVLCGVVFCLGCGNGADPGSVTDGAASPASSASPASGVEVLVTREAAAAPRGCKPREVAALVMRVFHAYNVGSAEAAKLVVPELAPEGGWWAVGGGPPSSRTTARSSGEFREYARRRFAAGEKLRLVELTVSHRNNGLADLGIKVARTADDLPPLGDDGWNTEGKGAFDCARQVIVVWSVSTIPIEERTDPQCPKFRALPDRVTTCALRG